MSKNFVLFYYVLVLQAIKLQTILFKRFEIFLREQTPKQNFFFIPCSINTVLYIIFCKNVLKY